MSPLNEQDLHDKHAQRLRLRLNLLRSSLSNLRSELTMERELLRLEKMETSRTELAQVAQTHEPASRAQLDKRSQVALQRQQSAIWFGRKLGEVEQQCSQVMEHVQRHIEPLRTIMSSMDTFDRDLQSLECSTSTPSMVQADDWDAHGSCYPQITHEGHDHGVWALEDRVNEGCYREQPLDGKLYSKGVRVDEMWRRGEGQRRYRGPNDWLDDEISLAGRFASCDDQEGISLLTRNSANSLWAQYD